VTIKQLIERGEGKAKHWCVLPGSDDKDVRYLYHYGTVMLVWHHKSKRVIDYDTGWGSVSDQNGMNTAFRVLNAPLYFSRKGGAEVVELTNKRVPEYEAGLRSRI